MKLLRAILSKLSPSLKKYGWYEEVLQSDTLCTLLAFAFGTVITVIFAVYNGVFGILNSSVWYGAFAGYLIILALQRILIIIVYFAVHKKFKNDPPRLNREKLKIYLANGAIVVPVIIALSVIILLLVTKQKPIVANQILAIANAAYTFYKITTAIINETKAKKQNDPIIQTVRNNCLTDALISVIMLESTLITTFGELTHGKYLLIAISGMFACAFILAMGSYMIISAEKKLRSKSDSDIIKP